MVVEQTPLAREGRAAIDRDEWLRTVKTRGFVGLPAEEAERLLGAVEVVTLPAVGAAPSFLPLVTFTAIHYNYAWFSYVPGDAHRSLGLRDALPLCADLLFLDPSTAALAEQALQRRVRFAGGHHLRLAGIYNAAHETERACVGLIYIAKLRQPGVECSDPELRDVRQYGNGALRLARDTFDAWSRALIDNLDAL